MSPCPGKCFAQARTPFSCKPLIYESLSSETNLESSPKDLLFIIGFLGLEFISATGAKFIFTPIDLH